MEKFLLFSYLFLSSFAMSGCSAGNRQNVPKSRLDTVQSDPPIGFVRAPGSCFNIGSEYKPVGLLPQVCPDPFYIMKTEVTQKEYSDLMGKDFWTPNCPKWCYGVGPTLPAYNIHWDDAVLYCNKLSKVNGYDTVYQYESVVFDSLSGHAKVNFVENRLGVVGYRLPTNVEWEYACKAGTHDDYFWGDRRGSTHDSGELTLLDLEGYNSMEPGALEHAWYFKNAGNRVHPVATKKPNNWGLHDMIGNVSEWTDDWFESDGDRSQKNRKDTSQRMLKTLRGGSAIKCDNCEGGELKYTSWYKEVASIPDLSYRIYPSGFRVVLTIKK